MLDLLRDAWWACSAPTSFFRHLDDEPARPLRAVAAAFVAVSLACGTLALAFVAATGSDGWWLVAAVTLALALPLVGMLGFLGGLVVVRPAGLALRSWEVVAWAYAPAGALALSLLPVALPFPAPSAAAWFLAFPVWHVVVLWAGLRTLGTGRPAVAMAWYVATLTVVPLLLAFIGASTISRGP
jgi:hypothetical protein